MQVSRCWLAFYLIQFYQIIMEVVEENKVGVLFSPAVLWIKSVRKRKNLIKQKIQEKVILIAGNRFIKYLKDRYCLAQTVIKKPLL